MKKVLESLKTQLDGYIQTSRLYLQESDVILENDTEDFKEILLWIKTESFIFQSNNGCNDEVARNESTYCEDKQKNMPKKRGPKPKTSALPTEPECMSDGSDGKSLNDSTVSTSSTRSRRAAAQAAEHKLAKVHSLVQLKTKLRRPTNFDEKQVNATSSPPAKCRRTRRNQSAGDSSLQAAEINDGITGEVNKNVVTLDNKNLSDKCLNTECLVSVDKLSTPTIKSYTHPRSRSTSSNRASKRKSKDLFNDSIPLSELNTKIEAPNSDPTHKTNRKKSVLKKDLDSGISSNEEELQQLMKANLPIAHSSPILLEPTECEFKGFDDQHRQDAITKETTFVVGIKSEETQLLIKKTLKAEKQESSGEEKDETSNTKSRTKVLKKKGTHTTVNMEEKENVERNNETHFVSKPEDSPNLHSQTRVLKKATDRTVKNGQNDKKNSEEDLESLSSPESMLLSQTQTIRKHNEQQQEFKSPTSEVAEQNVRSRTKTIKKKNQKEDQPDSTDDESNNMRSRTKTNKKGTYYNENNIQDPKKIILEVKINQPSSKLNRLPPLSPAPAKGDLVKKRVEDFEKMQTGVEESEEEKTVGRVTRNAVKIKVTAPAIEAQNPKQPRKMKQIPTSFKKAVRKSVDKGKRDKIKEEKENIPLAKSQATSVKQPLFSEQPRMTPLGVNNRMTPSSDSAHKPQANKWTNSATRPTPVETNSAALIQKQTTEEVEKKKKEEERLKRQAKEEEAKRKKEQALKATAEEARRKRVEKLEKAAATREAAEKERERLAAKAEKEKEEKMRQIAIEKEKQKGEQQKKKLLIQQKTLEHEERRKQEEAARLAKIKEQEEEQKRVQAMKEREQELLKQQKAELRLAETEKNKHQGGKQLGKIAAANNAKLKLQQVATPAEKTNGVQSSTSYEITPAREDRPLLPPKTENDYGIDDAHSGDSSDDESQPKKIIPVWAQGKNRERLLKVNQYIPKKLWDLFMECDPCPDINKMFAGNPVKKRVRTSSAVWRTPPKYSRVAP